MNTPIADFVRGYAKQNMTRFHMPGHKGVSFVGCESMDITEIFGADALYEADGIICESEQNATQIFNTARTIYSTEGSSQCIRAMMYLCMENYLIKNQTLSQICSAKRPKVLAARNVHKAFVYAAAVLDLDVEWMMPNDRHSLCSCIIYPSDVEQYLQNMDELPVAVYITSPDYLGGELDVKGIADVCHKYGTVLAVDNAHGAYLHFLEPSRHPIEMGADICCDSAHKTLPVLTGGAYLHIGKNAPAMFSNHAKSAMTIFGSTSPSYLTLMSLDLCNQYLSEGYREKLSFTVRQVQEIRNRLVCSGWAVEETEPLKLTIRMPKGMTGVELADRLRKDKIECEYADEEYLVCMITPENTEDDFRKFLDSMGKNELEYDEIISLEQASCEQIMSIRNAVFARREVVSIDAAIGRICACPMVSCPPAIPIVVSGERITKEHLSTFQHYHIHAIDVVVED